MNIARSVAIAAALVIPGTAVLSGVNKGNDVEPSPVAVSRITDRSGSSDAAGATAVKWGFMCPIAARWEDNIYAVNFTRTPDVPWDAPKPNEAPVAFWAGKPGGPWRSVLLDGPKRTYQTPVLLLGPEGRANVFTLYPGDGTLYWHQATSAANTDFQRKDIPMGWGAYLSGAIDKKGRALLVYWGNGASDPKAKGLGTINSGYKNSTLGYTLVDTRSGKSVNGIMDAPGAPYCYSQVAFNETGAHVFTIRSEVKDTLVCGTRNHYVELRYYYSPDPASRAKWKYVTIYKNQRACIQPLGIEVDPKGKVHLLYYYNEELAGGTIVPHRLIYAVSREPVTANATPEFMEQEIKSGGWDGRLFQTSNGRVHVVAYKAGTQAEWAQAPEDPLAKFGAWAPYDMTISQCRIFPISGRNGSTVGQDLEGVFIGTPNTPEQSSMFHFRLPTQASTVAGNRP